MSGERSVSDLLNDILHNVQDMFRSELRLARAEIRHDATQAVSAAVWLAIGLVFLSSAWIFALWTGVYALAAILPMWAATLVIAVAMTAAGSLVTFAGLRRFKRITLAPERTIASLQENLTWMKQPTK